MVKNANFRVFAYVVRDYKSAAEATSLVSSVASLAISSCSWNIDFSRIFKNFKSNTALQRCAKVDKGGLYRAFICLWSSVNPLIRPMGWHLQPSYLTLWHCFIDIDKKNLGAYLTRLALQRFFKWIASDACDNISLRGAAIDVYPQSFAAQVPVTNHESDWLW